jgi:hypothetical protein
MGNWQELDYFRISFISRNSSKDFSVLLAGAMQNHRVFSNLSFLCGTVNYQHTE